MNIGDVFYQQFLDGDLDAVRYLILELKRNDSKLSSFLIGEFLQKGKIKVNIERLKKDHKVCIGYGTYHEWWLVYKKGLKTDKLDNALKDKPVDIDYVLPLADRKLSLVGVKK